jgi:hypothetical protein
MRRSVLAPVLLLFAVALQGHGQAAAEDNGKAAEVARNATEVGGKATEVDGRIADGIAALTKQADAVTLTDVSRAFHLDLEWYPPSLGPGQDIRGPDQGKHRNEQDRGRRG